MAGSFAVGPLVGGTLTCGAGLALDLPHQPPARGSLCLAIVRRLLAESLDRAAPRVDRAGLVTFTGGLFLLVFALLRGNEAGLGQRGYRRFVRRGGGAAGRVPRGRGPRRAADAPAAACSATAWFTSAQVAAFGLSASLFAMWLYMTLYLQQILGPPRSRPGSSTCPATS